MFYCFIHHWYSTDAPCPVCFQPTTVTVAAGSGTANDVLNSEKKGGLDWNEMNRLTVQAEKELVEKYSKPLNSEWEIVEVGRTIDDIRSVKRLSDGEIFAIGDEVEYRSFDDKEWNNIVGHGNIERIFTALHNKELTVEINDKS